MGRLLCGADLGDGVTCHVPAAFSHQHRVDPCDERADTEALLNRADRMVPARGLAEALAGHAAGHSDNARPLLPRVDFRALLKNDDEAWTTKSRLQAVLGRPWLSTRLVDQLDKETAAQLVDRLEELVERVEADTQARIAGEVASAVHDKIHEISIDRSQRVEAVTRERFGRSRLS